MFADNLTQVGGAGFEDLKKTNQYDREFWSARELQPLLGYTQWRRFENAIKKAITSCEQSGNDPSHHFAGAGKPITGGKGAVQEVPDYHLSRFACYLIAQNGDPRKPQIAEAQKYFAIQTRRQEMSDQLTRKRRENTLPRSKSLYHGDSAMRQVNLLTTTVAAGLLVACLGAAPKAKDDGSIKLFNGKDLSGWTCDLAKPGVKMEDVWSVADGVLHCKGRPNGYIITKKTDFKNYRLQFDWRWPTGKGGNSGCLIHCSTPRTLGIWCKSVEVQLMSGNAGDFWLIGTDLDVPDEAKRAEDRRRVNLTDDSEKKPGEWNHMDIVCRGAEIIVKINGVLVNHATKANVTQGAIALQSEGTPIEFRNVKLTPLRP